MHATEDLRIRSIKEVITPAALHAELPMTERATETVVRTRNCVQRIIHGEDDRLLVVTGPCSIHDTAAAREYAERLTGPREKLREDLLIVMRGLLRKTAYHGRLEGADQRSRPERQIRHQQGIAPGPRTARRAERWRSSRRSRIPGHTYPSVPHGPGELGRDRRAHNRRARCTGSSPRGCPARWASRTALTEI